MKDFLVNFFYKGEFVGMKDMEQQVTLKKEKIKERFASALRYKGLTQKELADKSELSTRTVSRCANEGRLTEETARKLSIILGIPYKYLLCEIDEFEYEESNNIIVEEENIQIVNNNKSNNNLTIEYIFNNLYKYDSNLQNTETRLKNNWLKFDDENKRILANQISTVFLLAYQRISDMNNNFIQ
jgi:transcriptional regulator with XRE-family HTH domain